MHILYIYIYIDGVHISIYISKGTPISTVREKGYLLLGEWTEIMLISLHWHTSFNQDTSSGRLLAGEGNLRRLFRFLKVDVGLMSSGKP